jgi:hypothetical protein
MNYLTEPSLEESSQLVYKPILKLNGCLWNHMDDDEQKFIQNEYPENDVVGDDSGENEYGVWNFIFDSLEGESK